MEHNADTAVCEDTLLHGKTILVRPASDAEDVALELVTKRGCVDLLRNALVVEDAQLLFVFDVEDDL